LSFPNPIRIFERPFESKEELIERIGGADAVLPMGGTKLDKDVLAAVEARDIPVTGVRDYGDIGVAEWVAAQSIRYLQGEEFNDELAGTRYMCLQYVPKNRNVVRICWPMYHHSSHRSHMTLCHHYLPRRMWLSPFRFSAERQMLGKLLLN
jgi:hypothetical protein